MKSLTCPTLVTSELLASVSGNAFAHDPVFGIGPHVLFKDGVEAAVEVHSEKPVTKRHLNSEWRHRVVHFSRHLLDYS